MKFKEGKYAKKLFDSGKQYESIKYLEDKMRHFIDSDMLEEADAFSNCLAGILLEKANNLRIDNLIEESVKTRNNCKIYYEQCLELECNLGRFDYLPSTLGELSMLNSYEDRKKPFAFENELKEKTERLNALNIELNLNEKDKSVIDDEPEQDGGQPEKKCTDRER